MRSAQTLLISGFLILLQFTASAQQQVVLEDVEVTEDRIKGAKKYSGMTNRPVDILHMELDLQLDWEIHAINGIADLYAKPFFNPVDSVVLDAQGYKLHQVAQVLGGRREPVDYSYDGKKITHSSQAPVHTR